MSSPWADGFVAGRTAEEKNSAARIASLESALASAKLECEQSMQTIADLREANERMGKVLETLSHIRDSNPSDAMADMDPLDYARHMLFEARKIARAALQGGNDAR